MGGKCSKKLASIPNTHYNCRNNNADEPRTYMNYNKVTRSLVPDDKVKWSDDYDEYVPVEYTSSSVLKNPEWADPANPWAIFNWNKLTNVDRTSKMGTYEVIHGVPRNPVGRTGITGRGRLGKWGPNHAADPIVTRWKLDDKGKKVKNPESKKYILQFVAIQRSDTNEWAIPGGMCDPGETVSKTLKREFLEEAADATNPVAVKKNQAIAKKFDDFFKKGSEIYTGYVDDPRNTDNAWMETVVQSFHDSKNSIFKNFELKAGDDATSVQWMDIDDSIELYATHKEFIQKVAQKYKAHWSIPELVVKKVKTDKKKSKKEEKDNVVEIVEVKVEDKVEEPVQKTLEFDINEVVADVTELQAQQEPENKTLEFDINEVITDVIELQAQQEAENKKL